VLATRIRREKKKKKTYCSGSRSKPRSRNFVWVGVEQVRGIFYTTQNTLLLTCRGEGSLLVVEEKREADDHIG